MRALASVVHDPEGRLSALADKYAAQLTDLYSRTCIAATMETASQTLQPFQAAGALLVFDRAGRIGKIRRRALRQALEAGASTIHYCDLDRALHWFGEHREEITMVAKARVTRPFTFLGRTPKAWLTHPQAQRDTERITNGAVSALIGRSVDATSGSLLLRKAVAAAVVTRSTEPSNATDAEWPAIAFVEFGAGAFSSRSCDGLSFETPTYYLAEVAAAGSRDAWIQAHYDTPQMWSARSELAAASVAALVRVMHTEDDG